MQNDTMNKINHTNPIFTYTTGAFTHTNTVFFIAKQKTNQPSLLLILRASTTEKTPGLSIP